jgi:dienelactone hydrolase
MWNEIVVPAAGVSLGATVGEVEDASGIVVFAHGSGSSRHSPRNRAVAERLHGAGFATILLDLLAADEEAADERTGQFRFDIDLLADRLADVVAWQVRRNPALPIGLFGASTGAAAALVAATASTGEVRAIVSRGGRPDLAGDALSQVRAPTLLIVGGADPQVLALNRQAARLMGDQASLVIVQRATHLFAEPGALDQVCDLAVGWFGQYLKRHGLKRQA